MKKTYSEMTEVEREIERYRIKKKYERLYERLYEVKLSVQELTYIHKILTETKCEPIHKPLHDKLLRKLR